LPIGSFGAPLVWKCQSHAHDDDRRLQSRIQEAGDEDHVENNGRTVLDALRLMPEFGLAIIISGTLLSPIAQTAVIVTTRPIATMRAGTG
jgi:hypothetical protein